MPLGFSKVRIARMALSNIGSKSNIESLDENNTAALECNLWYDPARLQTLEGFNWGFARKSRSLAEHSVAAPTYRWAYRYQYPEDCVAPRYIQNPLGMDATAIPFEVENADDGTLCILTDEEDATLIYTFDLETVSLFSMYFVTAMSYALAAFIAPKLTGKTSVQDRMQRTHQAYINLASGANAEQRVPREPRDPSWIRERN